MTRQFFADHPLPWELSETSAGFAVEDANHEVLWRFDHYDRAEVERFIASLNDVVSVEEAPYIRGYNRGWDDALGERSDEPLRLTVAPDGSISRISGGPLEEPVDTGPTDDYRCPHGIDMFECDEHGWPA